MSGPMPRGCAGLPKNDMALSTMSGHIFLSTMLWHSTIYCIKNVLPVPGSPHPERARTPEYGTLVMQGSISALRLERATGTHHLNKKIHDRPDRGGSSEVPVDNQPDVPGKRRALVGQSLQRRHPGKLSTFTHTRSCVGIRAAVLLPTSACTTMSCRTSTSGRKSGIPLKH